MSQAPLSFTWSLTALAVALSLVPFVRYLCARRAAPPASPPPPEKRLAPPADMHTSPPDPARAPNHGYGAVRVSKILVHPIKSCRGTSVPHARYTPEGLEHDRKWCVIDARTHAVMTARAFSQADAAARDGGVLAVSFPADSGCASFVIPLDPGEETLRGWTRLENLSLFHLSGIDGYICEAAEAAPRSNSPSAILSEYFKRPVHLVFKGPRPRACGPTEAFPDLAATVKYQDGYPLLVLSEESLAEIEAELRPRVGTQAIDARWKDAKVAIERFRPNIVLAGAGAFAEDAWAEVAVGGGPAIALVSKCTRCLLPNVSPETGVRDAAVPYKVLMKFRTGRDAGQPGKPCVGCNGVPAASGEVRVGDAVAVRRLARQ